MGSKSNKAGSKRRGTYGMPEGRRMLVLRSKKAKGQFGKHSVMGEINGNRTGEINA